MSLTLRESKITLRESQFYEIGCESELFNLVFVTVDETNRTTVDRLRKLLRGNGVFGKYSWQGLSLINFDYVLSCIYSDDLGEFSCDVRFTTIASLNCILKAGGVFYLLEDIPGKLKLKNLANYLRENIITCGGLPTDELQEICQVLPMPRNHTNHVTGSGKARKPKK